MPQYSISDYNLWEDDWELIDGVPYKLPSSVGNHQLLSGELLRQIYNAIKNDTALNKNYFVVHTLDWIVNEHTVVRPDISINPEMEGDYLTVSPAFIIEILSPINALKERNQKFKLYEREGVEYYLLANPDAKTYQVFELINGVYQEQKDKLTFEICGQGIVTLNMDEAFAEMDR